MIVHKFTQQLKKIIQMAAIKANEEKKAEINTLHLLIALREQKGSLAWKLLNYEKIKPNVNLSDKSIHNLTKQAIKLKDLPFTKTAQNAIAKAGLIAYQGKHYLVGTEHLLAAIIQIKKGQAYTFLKKNKYSISDLEQHLRMLLDNASRFSQIIEPFMTGTEKEEKTKNKRWFDYFMINLNQKAREGKIDPVIGREREITRMINILGRRTKNNPVLLGEAGVGKTAIAEGLANKITQGEVPPFLKNKKILLLDLTALVAGTMFRGEFESRLKKILSKIENDPKIIIFIDELHNIIGTGGAAGSLDTANILKPALARGALRCIGATTLVEYQKHIEKDPALERRFQPVIINEPTREEAIKILSGIRENYEKFHGIKISEEAILEAVDLSQRYITDRNLPDKALDLIDEASAKARIRAREPKAVSRLCQAETELLTLQIKKRKAVNEEKYKAASLMKQQELKLNKTIQSLRGKTDDLPLIFHGEITALDIKEIISEMTNIPLNSLKQSEIEKLKNLEKFLGKKIVGQNEAISEISRCIRRAKSGLSNPNRPLGSFIFLGPSGVGKTYLAQILAKEIFGSEKNLVRIDMSEFHEMFNVSRLLGAPAGYVGYEEGGKLTEKIRRQPYSVVLFDEIEKAHPDALNILLQILEDGQLTDAQGRVVNFKNTIVIMTSNIGSAKLATHNPWGFQEENKNDASDQKALERNYQELKDSVLKDLENQLKPEFLNRIDKIIVFQCLNLKALTEIANLNINDLEKRLKDKQISVSLDSKAALFLAQKSFNPLKGARPLRKIISEMIEDKLADLILTNKVLPGAKLRIYLENESVKIKKENG